MNRQSDRFVNRRLVDSAELGDKKMNPQEEANMKHAMGIEHRPLSSLRNCSRDMGQSTSIAIDNENYHSLQAWFDNRHHAFENQLKLIVNMAFQCGLGGITATQVRNCIASNPEAVRKWGISSPAARLSTAKKEGILIKTKREGEREGAYVHVAHLGGGLV